MSENIITKLLDEVEAEIGQAFIDLAYQSPSGETVRSRAAMFASHRLFISMMEQIRARHETTPEPRP
jgi:hypothetical protein